MRLTFPVFAALLAAAVLLLWVGYQIPSEGRAENAARNLGLTNVHVVSRSYSWGVLGGCHEQDIVKFTVKGTDYAGHVRTVQVCAPVLGGYTVRS